MSLNTAPLDPLEALWLGPDRHALRIALAVPTSGALGMTGPSALACAVLAVEEVNARGGVHGRPLELVRVDAGGKPAVVAEQVRKLCDAGVVEAVCGYHTSDVHRQVERVTAGRFPYVFTPPHEGGHRAAGVVLLGEGPTEQLVPVVTQLASRRSLRRWALVGNDYIWPRRMHAAAAAALPSVGAQVVLTSLVPLGAVDVARLLSAVQRSRAQAVLLSLVGRDLATFNRAFAAAGLGARVVRVSGALEEHGLLEAGGDDTGGLYAAMRWFTGEGPGRSDELQDRYAARWGPAAPTLGTYARGCYQGVHLLADLGRRGQLTHRAIGGQGWPFAALAASRAGVRQETARLALADGLQLVVQPH